MMLLIQDSEPVQAAVMVPDRLKFKQLLELCQLICSAGLSDQYKTLRQGKELQQWIKDNQAWTFVFGISLFNRCCGRVRMTAQTKTNIINVLNAISESCPAGSPMPIISDVIFRYQKEYENTVYSTNTLLPVAEGISEYKRYIEWKNLQFKEKHDKIKEKKERTDERTCIF